MTSQWGIPRDRFKLVKIIAVLEYFIALHQLKEGDSLMYEKGSRGMISEQE